MPSRTVCLARVDSAESSASKYVNRSGRIAKMQGIGADFIVAPDVIYRLLVRTPHAGKPIHNYAMNKQCLIERSEAAVFLALQLAALPFPAIGPRYRLYILAKPRPCRRTWRILE